ncbi:ABC transporter ATP-binding protein [Bdellovibrionota bacterium FG-2]
MTEPVVSLQNVTKTFQYWSDQPSSLKTVLVDTVRGRFKLGGRRSLSVLEDVSFEIRPGEFVGIMGRNGCGKSTILKIICGIYAPSQGRVEVRGPIAPLLELGAGFHSELSGYENIFLNAAILGFGRKVTAEALPKILEFSELGDRIHMPTKNYSSGMLVRLGFSIATHLAAPVILVDEVLAVGDVGFQKKCLKKIEELHREGRTIVLVTHSPKDVRDHCNRCIVISERRKVFDGDPAEGSKLYVSNVMDATASAL